MKTRSRHVFWTIGTSAFVLLAILALTVFSLYKGWLRLNYPSEKKYPIRGIDISHHQGVIKWDKLQASHLDFVVIKATEGGDHEDDRFEDNYDSASAHGYAVGAYHFYRLCTDVNLQATNFLKSLHDKKMSLAPTVDLEFGGNCQSEFGAERTVQNIHVFLQLLEAEIHCKPMLYATKDFYDQYLSGDFAEYPIWIRDVYREPHLSDGRPWYIWQFANRARLPGIKTYVDLNVMAGTMHPIP